MSEEEDEEEDEEELEEEEDEWQSIKWNQVLSSFLILKPLKEVTDKWPSV